ncbi:MAG: dipicolinate synthase subunit DpsA [Eubacteriales bacterium]|nr:dipicolinate synthase subunit DpsA [Eubacteriales bacterium]
MRIAIIGDDKRQKSLADILRKNGYCVSLYGKEIKCENKSSDSQVFADESSQWCNLLKEYDILILPLPYTRDGKSIFTVPTLSLDALFDICKGKRVLLGSANGKIDERILKNASGCYDYNSSEGFQYINARMTAEAALAMAIEKVPISVFGANTVVVGYGRIGSFLSDMLSLMGANVTVCARKERDLARAAAHGYNAVDISKGFVGFKKNKTDSLPDMIFNTVPAKVFTSQNSAELAGCPLFDLAGKGVTSEYCGEVIPALSLPALISPISAALAVFCGIKDKLT